jgi:hypothetical protein
MLYRITKGLKDKLYARLERTLFIERETDRQIQRCIDQRAKESQSSMVSSSNETKIPDPWF